MHSERMSCKQKGRDQSDEPTRQEMPKISKNFQTMKRQGRILPSSIQGEPSPANSFISHV